MPKLDKQLLELVKKAFVPMPGGNAEPVAGASQMTAGMTAPMGMDPNAMGMDPNAMGMDPNAMGMNQQAPVGQISMSVPEFIELIQALRGENNSKAAKSTNKADVSSKLDAILQALQIPSSNAP